MKHGDLVVVSIRGRWPFLARVSGVAAGGGWLLVCWRVPGGWAERRVRPDQVTLAL